MSMSLLSYFMAPKSASYTRAHDSDSRGPPDGIDVRTPLLSSRFPQYEDDALAELKRKRAKHSWAWRHRRFLVTIFGMLALSGAIAILAKRRLAVGAAGGDPEPAVESEEPAPEAPHVSTARLQVENLFSQQSKTLSQARARYSLKTHRQPPRNFDHWFHFARENKCLIDEYDQIHRDFAPFYQLAKEDPVFFQKMIDRGSEMMLEDPKGMTTIKIQAGEVHMPEYQGTSYYYDWPRTLGRFAKYLPDMDFMLNGRDEPRVLFNHRELGSKDAAQEIKDTPPFEIAPHPTGDFFKNRPGCTIAKQSSGFAESANDDVSFLISSSSTDFTTDLYPLLSMTKISPCFSDILFPGQYFYEESGWSGKFAYPDNVPWEEKKSQLYWRGMSNGGHIIGDNYRHFARFKLIDLARDRSDVLDVKMTQFAETHCTSEEECARDAIIEEYGIHGPGDAREAAFNYKYLLDVDGNTFSGRFLGLLRTGSLVFKSTVFNEYFNDWLKPYEHYIPVLPDLSDLLERIAWAEAHPEEARLIQENGK
ncbi:glycosyl transferase family 90-domain-containing protein [Mycena maculata]|uniref:Glycosyl transferase family 90-domain-containing protein n=1 Tax=Mycena maculata TaxID=230809 RepID=A0AAD7IWH2_9AGAR|nr:glycosyl transferase family 90-domain-containing protein [Mycena maculata]